MNNEVREYGQVVGYRCYTCYGVYPMMWGNTCNKCREDAKEHAEMVTEMKKLRKELEDLKLANHP